MKVPLKYAQRAKIAVHGLQAFFIFLAFVLTLVVLVSTGPDDSRTRFFFAMCWLSIPALIYQTMVPMWSKVQKFANPYAYAAVDALMTLMWFIAFIAVATWNSSGISKGEDQHKKDKNPPGGCAVFAFGSQRRCQVSKASVGMGIMVTIFFAITTAVSVTNALKFRKTGKMPGAFDKEFKTVDQDTKDAFDNQEHYDEEVAQGHQDEYGYGQNAGRAPGRNREDDQYGLLHQSEGGVAPGESPYHNGSPYHSHNNSQHDSPYHSHNHSRTEDSNNRPPSWISRDDQYAQADEHDVGRHPPQPHGHQLRDEPYDDDLSYYKPSPIEESTSYHSAYAGASAPQPPRHQQHSSPPPPPVPFPQADYR